MPNVQHKRGTRAALNALAASNGLLVGQIYFITDENRLAVGLTISSYQAMAKQGEGGGSSAAFGTAEINFGAYPGANEASIAVTGQTSILAGSVPSAWVNGGVATVSHTADDHKYAAALVAITCGPPSAGVGFTIHARSLEKMTGRFSVQWSWA